MSNRSRGRHRFNVPAAAEGADPDAAERDAKLADAVETLETDKKSGLSKLVGLILDDREKELSEPARPDLKVVDPPADKVVPFDPDAKGLREPTAYEAAILHALGARRTVMYGGRRRVVAGGAAPRTEPCRPRVAARTGRARVRRIIQGGPPAAPASAGGRVIVKALVRRWFGRRWRQHVTRDHPVQMFTYTQTGVQHDDPRHGRRHRPVKPGAQPSP